MVRALLDGRKTMTRRLAWRYASRTSLSGGRCVSTNPMMFENPSPWQRVKPGERLWVRENFALELQGSGEAPIEPKRVMYAADGKTWDGPTVPCIHMPRWASRLTLTVTAVKIERLHDISEADKLAEGATPDRPFGTVWKAIHGEDGWAANPEVVAISFTVERRNIDTEAAA